ncbi:DUF4249 family protein [bacterium]|nr:DUF4249 family protein [bacterium]
MTGKRYGAFVLLGMLIASFPACVEQPLDAEYEDEIAVFGFLRGETALDSAAAILITRTQPLKELYTLSEAALSGGTVTMTEVNTGLMVSLAGDSARPGLFYNESLYIRSGYTYRLQITTPDRQVSAETTVPESLRVTSALKDDSINVVSPDRLSQRVPLYLEHGDSEQLIVVDMNCRETWETAEYINPFFGRTRPGSDAEFGGGEDTPPKHITAVGRFREMGDIDPDGGCTISWYSSMIAFYGSYTLTVAAIDDNYHRYLTRTSHPEMEGGIQGGIGVFGSLSGRRYDLFVARQ